MWNMSRSVLILLLVLVSVPSAFAQNTPLPIVTPLRPLIGYVGRYLDSGQILTAPQFWTISRAGLVKTAPERDLILMRLSGNRFGVYRMSSFVSRLDRLDTDVHGARYLMPDVLSVDPELPGSGWTTMAAINTVRLVDFDYDDRGYFYLAYSKWGFGVVDGSGALKAQVLPESYLREARLIFTVSAESRVYVIVSDAAVERSVFDNAATTSIYDVTDPAAPLFLRNLPFGIVSYAKLASGALAVVTHSGTLNFYRKGADFVTGAAPEILTAQPNLIYSFVTTDRTSLFALQTINPRIPDGHSQIILSTFAPTGDGLREVSSLLPPLTLANDLRYGAGYLMVEGALLDAFGDGPNRVLLYEVGSSTATNILQALNYHCQCWYQGMVPFTQGGQTYLIAARGLVGDVFTLNTARPPRRRTVSR
jgi:hypothetical protein